jgi:carbonic anhydrase
MLKFVALTTLLSSAYAVEWNYQTNQGEDWRTTPIDTCGEPDQSPIDLTPSTATDIFTAVPFIYSAGWQNPQSATIKNNGHTLQVDILGGSTCGTCGDGMPRVTGSTMGTDVFEVLQFHLHWGNTSDVGSEHTLDGAYYPAELHVVTWNTSYASATDAFNSGEYGSLAVLGFFLELNDCKAPILNFINRQNILQVRQDGNSIPATIDLSKVWKNINSYNFYHYKGSLTTPPCHEAVIWNVFEDTIPITSAQLDLIRTMIDSDGYLMGNNYREILPLGDRTLYHYSKDNSPAYCFPEIGIKN